MKFSHTFAALALVLFIGVTCARAQDKVAIHNNTKATLVGLFMSLNDLKSGEPDWEHNIIHNDPMTPGETIEVQAFEGEACETYIIGIAENGDWWYVEQDTCKEHKVDLVDGGKGEGKKHTK
jgi:hypothetical protein